MSHMHIHAQVDIPDGVVYLVEDMMNGSRHADPENTFRVYAIRDGRETPGRTYKTLQGATNRFNTIVAAHTPPKGYQAPESSPALSQHPLYGRF